MCKAKIRIRKERCKTMYMIDSARSEEARTEHCNQTVNLARRPSMELHPVESKIAHTKSNNWRIALRKDWCVGNGGNIDHAVASQHMATEHRVASGVRRSCLHDYAYFDRFVRLNHAAVRAHAVSLGRSRLDLERHRIFRCVFLE